MICRSIKCSAIVAGLHVRSPKCSQAQILASGLCLPYVAFAVSVGLCICSSCSRHYLAACTCFATRPPNRVRDSMQVRFRSAIADGPPIQPEPPPAARPNALALAGRRLGFVCNSLTVDESHCYNSLRALPPR